MAYEVFISYSHRDKKLRIELDKHLANLKRAQIILLLVSADFMATSCSPPVHRRWTAPPGTSS